MASKKKPTRGKPTAKAKKKPAKPAKAARSKPAKAAKRAEARPAAPAKKPAAPAVRPAAVRPAAAPAKPPVPGKPGAKPAAAPGKPAPAAGRPQGRPGEGAAPKAPGAKKSSRRSSASRRGSEAAGEILLPGGPQGGDELHYFFRGCVAAEHPNHEAGIAEVLAKRAATIADPAATRAELSRAVAVLDQRFEGGHIEPQLPPRPQSPRRTFQTVQERARHRRREIGAFMRGLDLGRTESSHMDSHGEASLQALMEWAARLENLAEADEPDQADYNQFHRGLDQLESTTEALVVDVEATLRRLRDRIRAR